MLERHAGPGPRGSSATSVVALARAGGVGRRDDVSGCSVGPLVGGNAAIARPVSEGLGLSGQGRAALRSSGPTPAYSLKFLVPATGRIRQTRLA